MDQAYTSRGGPELKQGWTPPLPFLAIFAIVMFLLSLSHYNSYKDQMHNAAIGFKFLLFLAPVFLIIFLRSSLTSLTFNFWSSQPRKNVRLDWAHGAVSFPWGVAVLVVLLLVLVSYQSSFHSQWFSVLRSD